MGAIMQRVACTLLLAIAAFHMLALIAAASMHIADTIIDDAEHTCTEHRDATLEHMCTLIHDWGQHVRQMLGIIFLSLSMSLAMTVMAFFAVRSCS